jgi:signal transduction histidine kinase
MSRRSGEWGTSLNLTRNTYGAYRWLLLIVGMLAALLISLSVVSIGMNPPGEDMRLLFLFMSGTGGASMALAYLLYRRGAIQWFNSLRWTLLATIILMVLLIFVNVWVTAQLMFISRHDLILTTALLIFAGVVAAVSIFFISSAWIERIYELGRAAQKLAQGDFRAHLSVQGNDELAQLAYTFNQTAEALRAVDEQKRQLDQTRRDLVAWVSHDLRTPLAAIRAMNESMLDGVVTDTETVARYHQTIQRELQHLSRMIDDLFDLAQLDTGHLSLNRVRASFRDLVSDTLGGLSARAARLGITLTGEVEPGIDVVSIAPDKIERVLYNLLDNALRHTPAGGSVTLKARRSGPNLEVSIHNTGQPIAGSDLPHIFTRFYRGEASRTQGGDGYRGTGLGLAIVKGFVEAHGGQIQVVSKAESGTSFTFTLPF